MTERITIDTYIKDKKKERRREERKTDMDEKRYLIDVRA